MSGNRALREWRGSRVRLWLSVVCRVFFTSYLLFVTLSLVYFGWDQPGDRDTPFSVQVPLLFLTYALFGFMLLWSCWWGWACRHARLRLDANGIEFQEGLHSTLVRFDGVKKVFWHRHWQSATLAGTHGRTKLHLSVYAPNDQREIATAIHEALGAREQQGWEAFAPALRLSRPPPVSLPRSERNLFRWSGGLLAVSVIAAAGLLWAPHRFELHRGFWLLEVFCAGGAAALALVAIRELIYYQRTGKVFAGLGLALTACAVAVVTMAYAISTHLIHLRPH